MRPLNEIIIHCSDTPASYDIGVTVIKQWHIEERNFSDIGYHFVIRRDGSIERGRPIEKMGAHCKGKNRNSIGICWVGGRKEGSKQPEDNRTPAQIESLKTLVTSLKIVFNIDKTSGHYKYSKKTCPNFNVEKEF